jgi:hypothetical protein
MTPENELEIVRRAFAKQTVHAARTTDPRLEQALARCDGKISFRRDRGN